MVLDEELEQRIAEILRSLTARWRAVDADAIRAGNRKQAVVPAGAVVLEPAGTAPGLVVPPADGNGPVVVVLPGPPGELQQMWPQAVASTQMQAALADATTYRQRTLRLFGVPESEIAETLRVAEDGHGLQGLEITTCLRRGEIEVVTRYEPAADAAYDAFERTVRERHVETLFSIDGSTVDEQVAAALRERGWTIATAESCTAGLLAARLTQLPGSSAYVAGGIVAYADAAKVRLVDVPSELIAAHGAVSIEVAQALARGARERLSADVGIGITGIAGPGGGSVEKPVGLVCFAVEGPRGSNLTLTRQVPGNRADVRDRSTTIALHLVRQLLAA
jgi:nicotinamide-nucleotide amidase